LEKLSSAIKIDRSTSLRLKSGDALAKENVLLWIGVHGNSFTNLLVLVLLLFKEIEIVLFLLFSISTIYPFLLSKPFRVNLSLS
jgi:hypothetical protein